MRPWALAHEGAKYLKGPCTAMRSVTGHTSAQGVNRTLSPSVPGWKTTISSADTIKELCQHDTQG